MKTISEIYEAGRDVNGGNHCCITWFNPEERIEILFPGLDWWANRQKFIADYVAGYRYAYSGEKQNLVIYFGK